MDLQYLFFHRGASFVRQGGRMLMLTTAYWMSATNADRVRQDMAERLAPEVLVRLEQAGAFADAPGQHSLISMFRRPRAANEALETRALSLDKEPEDWPGLIEEMLGKEVSRSDVCVHPSEQFGAGIWSPFASATNVSWGRRLEDEGTTLSELLADRQGFVSGADRFSSRHPKHYPPEAVVPEKGAPIFLFERDQVPEELAVLGPTVLRPLLRASALEPNTIITTPPHQSCALYLDDELDSHAEAVIERHLGRFRPVLERRREVRTGSMPWYRLHWPRDRAEQTGPKLVVPRRASAPCFALDLSASAVSSDCTYLVAPDDIDDPLHYLVTLMVALNSAPTERYLRNFGKAKGRQLEFYSQPLRSLPLGLRLEEGRLEWVDELAERAERAEHDALIDRLVEGL
jgi:adenine-specific DNA-methyltransferase